jgi:hypothetical protein
VVWGDPKAITRDVACYLSALSVSYGVMLAARESPEMIEEERERAESHSSSGGAHEVEQRP